MVVTKMVSTKDPKLILPMHTKGVVASPAEVCSPRFSVLSTDVIYRSPVRDSGAVNEHVGFHPC